MLSVPMPLTPSSPHRFTPSRDRFSPAEPAASRGDEPSVEYLCQKYEALQKQLISVENSCAEQVQRQERLQKELRNLKQPQDAIAREERQTSLLRLREATRLAKQGASAQAVKLQEEQLAGVQAEQRCAQLAEECKRRSLRYDNCLQQLAQQDREIAMYRFEGASASRRLEQSQADAQVIKEDLRVESQRQLLAESQLQDLEKSLQTESRQLMLSEQEVERVQRALAEQKQEVMDFDVELLSCSESLTLVQQEKQRQALNLAREEEECQQVDGQVRASQQELLKAQQANEQQTTEIKAQTAECDSLRGDLCALEQRAEALAAESQAASECIAEVEKAIRENRLQSIQVFRERDSLVQQVEELKGEQQQLDGLCLALRRQVHAEGLIMEDMETELQMAFKRKETLLQEIAVNSQASLKLEEDLEKVRPQLLEADQRSASLEMSLVQKSKELEELLRERSLRHHHAPFPT